MYHAIVRRRIRRIFAELNRGNFEPVLAGLGDRFEHVFAGEHALAGLRTGHRVTRAWYERLFRIFPGLQFELHAVLVNGWPWATTVAVEWSDRFALRDGRAGANAGVHVIRLRWGKVVSVAIHCDTQRLVDYLATQAAAGVLDAARPPLVA